MDSLDQRIEEARRMMQLTPRQVEVLAHVVRGASNKEIAVSLGLAENTIELHMTKLLRKAALQSRTQLIAQFWSARSTTDQQQTIAAIR